MAKLDVAIPNFEYGAYLHACVTSVLSQGIDDMRVVIIDNASGDNSVEVARALMKTDPRVSLIVHDTNLGVHASLNESLDWAESEYFIMVCADDVLAPGFLRRAIGLMDAHPTASLCYGIEVPFRTGDHLPTTQAQPQPAPTIMRGHDFIEARFREAERIISCGTTMVRTAAQKTIGYYRHELKMTLDLEFLMRLALTGDVICSNDTHAFRRLHGSNYSTPLQSAATSDLIGRAEALQSFLDHVGHTMPNAAALRARMQRRLAARAYWWGLRNLAHGHAKAARGCFGYAFNLAPLMMAVPPIDFLWRDDGPIKRPRSR